VSRNVLVTGGSAAAVLRARGHRVSEVPLLRIAPPEDWAPLDTALARLRAGAYAWVAFTSANAVRAVRERGADLGRARVACVGPATAAELPRVDLLAPRPQAAALAAALTARLRGGERVLFPRAANAGPTLKEALTAAGATVDDPVAYRTLPDPEAPARLRLALAGGVDLVVFASGEAVRRYAALGGPLDLPAVCIGPVTAGAARAAGFRRVHVAARPDPEAVAAVVEGVVQA
jgi:uroporphyrinogen-III synthase